MARTNDDLEWRRITRLGGLGAGYNVHRGGLGPHPRKQDTLNSQLPASDLAGGVYSRFLGLTINPMRMALALT